MYWVENHVDQRVKNVFHFWIKLGAAYSFYSNRKNVCHDFWTLSLSIIMQLEELSAVSNVYKRHSVTRRTPLS